MCEVLLVLDRWAIENICVFFLLQINREFRIVDAISKNVKFLAIAV